MDLMAYSVMMKYYRVIENIKAEEMFDAINASSYPELKLAKKRDFITKLKRRAKAGITSKSGLSVKEQAMKAARMLNNG